MEPKFEKSTGLPYVSHPIRVALILKQTCFVVDEDTLIAAILHDVIEDTPVTAKEIDQVFGQFVMSIVLEVTDDKSLSVVARKRAQIEHVKTMTRGSRVDQNCRQN